MRVDFIELLRCPACHEPSALVTVADRRDDDRLIHGTLGCPVCLAEYPLHSGVADLTTLAGSNLRRNATAQVTPPPDAMRLAALLSLAEPGLRVALCGTYALAAEALSALTEAHCLAINAPTALAGGVSGLQMDAGNTLPLAAGSLSALAVDALHAPLLADVARVLRGGGRVVAPFDTPVPPGLCELARDAAEWVAQVETSTATPVRLLRAR